MKKYLSMILSIFILTGCTVPEREPPVPTQSVSTEAPVPTISAEPTPEAVRTPPPMPESPTYIPQELIALVADAVAAESEAVAVSSMAVGKVLTGDEMFALMDGEGQPEGLWDDLRSFVEPGFHSGSVIFQNDGDNDGYPDIVAVITQGSGGFTGIQYYRGQPEGGYENTYNVHNLLSRSSYDFLLFEDKLYFLSANIDYNTKRYGGMSLFAFQDGVPVEEVCIAKNISGYAEDMRQGETVYTDKLAQMTFSLRSEYGDYAQRAGTAEREEPERREHYRGDLDNDGVEESYQKHTWYPSTYFQVLGMHFEYAEGQDGAVTELLSILSEHGYVPQILWADKEEQGNVLYTISNDQNGGISSDAWLYREGQWEHMAQVLFAPEYEVKTSIYTQDLNIDYLDTKAFL